MKRLSLSIPTPCHEPPSSFTRTPNGSFCSSCQKEVIDFSSWSEERLVAYFRHGKVACGRFRPDQLKTYIAAPARRPRLRVFASALIMTIIGLFWQRPSAAQTKERQRPLTEQRVTADKEVIQLGKVGALADPMVGSQISKGPNDGILLPDVNIVDSSYVKLQTMVLGGLVSTRVTVVNRLSPKRLWNNIRELFRSKPVVSDKPFQVCKAAPKEEVVPEAESSSVSCYPNPTTGKLNVRLPDSSKEKLISISSLQGVVIEERISLKSEEQFSIGDLAPGLYLVKTEVEGAVFWARVVKR